jgi:RimJ/RimL family protein N-acetyltransferase
MSEQLIIRTPRLVLRPWREADLPALAAMHADPRVMEHLPNVLSREESDQLAKRVDERLRREGYGRWAVEIAGGESFIGSVGFAPANFAAHFTPAVEIGWRFAFEHWGKGYATEAAGAAIEFGFRKIGLKEIVSFTVSANQRSRRVMERLGMSHDPADDFDHPEFPEGHRLRRHVLYRLKLVRKATTA